MRRQPVCVDKVSTDSPPRRRRRNWDAPCPAHPSPCQGLFTQTSSANVCRRSKLGDCCQPEGWRLAPAVQREQAAAAAVRKMQTMLCGAACRCCSIRATAARTHNSRGCRAYQTPCRWPPGTNHQSFAALPPLCAAGPPERRQKGGSRPSLHLLSVTLHFPTSTTSSITQQTCTQALPNGWSLQRPRPRRPSPPGQPIERVWCTSRR